MRAPSCWRTPTIPTGKTYTREELQALLEIARRRSLILIVDESFSEFVHDRQAWDAGSIPADPALVVVNSFSKNFHLQGLRLGACLVHRRHFESTVTVHQTILSAAPSLSQHVAMETARARRRIAAGLPRAARLALSFVARAGWRAHPPRARSTSFPKSATSTPFARGREAQRAHPGGRRLRYSYGRHFRLCFGKPKSELTQIFDRLSDLVPSSQ